MWNSKSGTGRGAIRSGKCSILGNIQGQAGHGTEQTDQAEGVPVQGGCNETALKSPFQSKPFWDSVSLSSQQPDWEAKSTWVEQQPKRASRG